MVKILVIQAQSLRKCRQLSRKSPTKQTIAKVASAPSQTCALKTKNRQGITLWIRGEKTGQQIRKCRRRFQDYSQPQTNSRLPQMISGVSKPTGPIHRDLVTLVRAQDCHRIGLPQPQSKCKITIQSSKWTHLKPNVQPTGPLQWYQEAIWKVQWAVLIIHELEVSWVSDRVMQPWEKLSRRTVARTIIQMTS